MLLGQIRRRRVACARPLANPDLSNPDPPVPSSTARSRRRWCQRRIDLEALHVEALFDIPLIVIADMQSPCALHRKVHLADPIEGVLDSFAWQRSPTDRNVIDHRCHAAPRRGFAQK